MGKVCPGLKIISIFVKKLQMRRMSFKTSKDPLFTGQFWSM
jgi:hypothetical protein